VNFHSAAVKTGKFALYLSVSGNDCLITQSNLSSLFAFDIAKYALCEHILVAQSLNGWV